MTPQHSYIRPLLFDGGLGRELDHRNVELSRTIWSAAALLNAPRIVQEIHLDYINAGADIITTNTYGVIRNDLAKANIEERFRELNILACRLALEARRVSGKTIHIAGSLPPLRGSFRPDLVGPPGEIMEQYLEQARILADHVDLLLCETMSSIAEARAAAQAACSTEKPVWVSWTLHEDRSGRLRSGESVEDAITALADLPVRGFLANCCAPEAVSRFLEQSAAADITWKGGYANTFSPMPEDWMLDGADQSDGLLPYRKDLDPESYVSHVCNWLDAGATVVGGCCGTRPIHTDKMRQCIDKKFPSPSC